MTAMRKKAVYLITYSFLRDRLRVTIGGSRENFNVGEYKRLKLVSTGVVGDATYSVHNFFSFFCKNIFNSAEISFFCQLSDGCVCG